LKLNKFEEALAYFEKASEIDPDDFTLLNKIGACYNNNQEHETALTYFKKAYALRPRYVRVVTNLAIAYFGLKNYEEGMKYFIMSLIYNPDSSVVWNYMMMLCDITNHPEHSGLILNRNIEELKKVFNIEVKDE